MPAFEYARRSASARTLIVSQRAGVIPPARCPGIEFEDVVADIDDVDMIVPHITRPHDALISRAARGLERRGLLPSRFNEGREIGLDRDYDLVVIVCLNLLDLLDLWPIKRWLRHARTSVCLLNEIWVRDVHSRPGEIALLNEFDHVFSVFQGTVPALAAATRRSAHFLPPGLDTLRFSQIAGRVPRVIDLYAMGRCPRPLHLMLRNAAANKRWFYLYDIGSPTIDRPDDHRQRMAELVQRVRFFVVNEARADSPEFTAGQLEVGYRFFEGAASGAILTGPSPKAPTFRDLFDWEDSFVPWPDGTTDPGDILEEFESDPARVERARRASITGSLLRHDVAHRWQTLLSTIGLSPLPALAARLERLNARAQEFPPPPTELESPASRSAFRPASRTDPARRPSSAPAPRRLPDD